MEDFLEWIPLGSLTLLHLPSQGRCASVYALRDSKDGDILKYGCTGCLRTRIFGNYIGGVGGKTTQRIHSELFNNGMLTRVEIAWIETADRAEAERKEKQFRRAYTQTKGRRPIWDRLD